MTEVLRSVRRNLATFVLFELTYGIVGSLAISFFYNVVFRVAVYLSVGYIAAHTFLPFLMHPLCWLAVLLFLVWVAGFNLYGIVGVVYLNECGRRDLRVSVKDVILLSAKASIRALRPRNWQLILLVLLIVPLLNFGVIPVTFNIVVPDFIMEYIGYYWYLTAACAVVVALMVLLMIRWRFAITSMVVEDLSFADAARRSAKLAKGHHVGDLVRLFVFQASVAAFTMAAVVFSLVFAYITGETAASIHGVASGVMAVTSAVLALTGLTLSVGVSFLAAPLGYTMLSSLYHKRCAEAGHVLPEIELPQPKEFKRRPIVLAAFAAFSVAVVGACSFLIVIALNGTLAENVSAEQLTEAIGDHRTTVVAHRCGAHYAPENTVAALNKAADMGVDWCEIDAQQLKDGTVIVMHDTNFARTTGFDKDSWLATWDEVERLDAGSSFSEEYRDERIPLLDQMIKAAKERGIKLQIELKPTGNERDLEQAVIDVIRDNDFLDDCRVASQDYPCLEKVRSLDKDVRTLYITSAAYGDILKAEAADDFSIEATWITPALVDYLHDNGRSVFAWTVNSESIMKSMVGSNVDQLVTDEVKLALEVVQDESEGNVAERIAAFLGMTDEDRESAWE